MNWKTSLHIVWWHQCNLRKMLQFLLSFKLGNSVSGTYPARKLFHNENQLPYPAYIPCLKENSHNLTNYERKGTSQKPTSLLFSELGKIWKYSLSQYSKIHICNLIHELGKMEKYSQSNIQKSQFLINFCELQKV